MAPAVMLYAVVRRLASLLLQVFYRRIRTAGLEHVPPSGPVILVANHHNALVDPLLILAAIPRRIVPVAKAPLFVHPVLGPLLRAVGAIPVERRQDAAADGGRADPSRNMAMFARAGDALRSGSAVLIFPEGVSQPEPVLMPLRTGAARLLLGTAGDAAHANTDAAEPSATLVPVGLVYDDPASFRGGEALVLVGPPIDVRDVARDGRAVPEASVRALTERIADTLRGLMLEAHDRETLELVRVAEGLAEQEGRTSGLDPAARAAWRRRAIDVLARGSAAAPEPSADLEPDAAPGALQDLEPATAPEPSRDLYATRAVRSELGALAGELARAGLTGRELEQSYPASAVLRYTWREGSRLLLGLPAALLGMVIHAVPYRLTAVVVGALQPKPDLLATYKLAVGLAVYPLCWAAEAWLAWRLGGRWLLVVLCAGIVPGGLIALAWQERLAAVRRQARGFWHFLTDRDRHGHLVARRRAVVEALEELMADVDVSRPAQRREPPGVSP